MKTKPSKKAVEAVLDELYPYVRQQMQSDRDGRPIDPDWRAQSPFIRATWGAVARWHLGKMNARKP